MIGDDPIELSFKQVLQIAAVGFALYFPATLYLQMSYVKQPKASPRTWLTGPFIHTGGSAYIANLPKFDTQADSSDDPYASDLVLYEGGKPIGPAHTIHIEIVERGAGRYSHWKGQGLIFSASDNSNPNTNGNNYWVRIEPPTP